MRFAWMVNPRNYLLLGVHTSNVVLQSNLLFRRIKYEWENPELIQKQKEEFLRRQLEQKENAKNLISKVEASELKES